MTISQHNANQTITELSFRSGTDRLALMEVRESYSIDDLLDMALQRHVVTQYPFVYEYPASTALNQLTFYEHDHLGNLRVAFTPVVDCNSPTGTEPDPGLNHPNSSFTLEQVVDYYPYGKILRQYVNANGPEKYLTTQHERDQETGLDYRGARYYDSDVARFLSLDPAQAEYPSWSPYNYVMGNPISLIDPDGRRAGEYEWSDGQWNKTSTKGDKIGVDFYHSENNKNEQITYVTDRKGNWNTIKNGRDALRGESRGSDVGWGQITNEFMEGWSPERSFFEGNHPANEAIKNYDYKYRSSLAKFKESGDPKKAYELNFWPGFDNYFSGPGGQAQMMGSYNLSFYKLGDKTLSLAQDTKSRSSVWYHLPGIENRNRGCCSYSGAPGWRPDNRMTTTYQTYLFFE